MKRNKAERNVVFLILSNRVPFTCLDNRFVSTHTQKTETSDKINELCK